MTTRKDLIENIADRSAVVREMEEAGYHDGYFGLVEAREAERQARCELSAWDRTHLNYESANTHQLNNGDVIEYYGCRFQLKNKKVWPMEGNADPIRQAEVVTFDTDLLVYCGDVMPRHWADRWTVQGNKLAMWCRLVDPSAC